MIHAASPGTKFHSCDQEVLMFHSGPPQRKLLGFPERRQNAIAQAKDWTDGILESNDNLRAALELLRNSYCALLTGLSVKEDAAILAQVEAILKGGGSSRRNAVLARSAKPATREEKGPLSENDAETC
jgi:hypothetical protein